MSPHMRMAMLLDTWRPSAHMNAISGADNLNLILHFSYLHWVLE